MNRGAELGKIVQIEHLCERFCKILSEGAFQDLKRINRTGR